MATGWQYRIASVVGTASLTALAVVAANLAAVQDLFATVPYLGRPAPVVLSNGDLTLAISTTVVVVFATMWPLFRPQPRRILDILFHAGRRLTTAMIGLAALGYFNYTYRLPRSTLMLTTAVLVVWLPAWLVAIRHTPHSERRAAIVGDDPEKMETILQATELAVCGYVSPPSKYRAGEPPRMATPSVADGGQKLGVLSSLTCLGGLSRLDEILVDNEIDTVLLAFEEPDRAEFFGTLATCHDNGVTAKIHREHADNVLAAGPTPEGQLVDVDLEPWDWQDRMLKQAFDIAFALTALVALSPVIFLIAILIKLDDGGPILYSQDRTAEFGGTFTVYKFRSMVTDAEDETGATLSEEDRGRVDPRVTRVGHLLRKTHLDEIPQLWSILKGDMSVVGPRPERPELDADIETTVGEWRRRWFVRPGLTGLAQIRGATGHEPAEKLRYDIEYIRRQSFWFDLKVVIRQLWQVCADAVDYVNPGSDK